MTQLPEGAAVGGSDEPVIAAQPTVEDRFAAFTDDEKKQDEDAPQQAGEAQAEPELTVEDVTEAEAPTGDEPDAPIVPPVSWTAEEKEEFKTLPRALQETLTRRETEREKFVQSKAQEAKQVETRITAQASEALTNLQNTYAKQLNNLLVQVPDRPSHQLQAEDPYTYAEQMDAHERAAAHNQWIEQQVGTVAHQLQQAQQAAKAKDQAETLAVLTNDFPEFLDPVKGAELRQALTSTALELGYAAEQLADADHNDIKAMKVATDWRDKAAKYDKLMAQKMEKVRQAKDLPKVSRPGTAQAPGQAANARYTADRQAMQQGDKDAATRVFSRFL